MINVLIVGATGYIGQALCFSLVRSGSHRVYGLARTPEKARQLAAQEVIPIIDTIREENTALLHAIDVNHINIVVDVSGANHDSRTLLNTVKTAGRNLLAAASGVKTPKLGFIYTSGTWVHGSSLKPVNDLLPVGTSASPTPPATLTAWRPQLEQEVLAASDVLDTMVIRPALVYGRSCAIWTSLFTPLLSASSASPQPRSVSVAADLDSRPGLVHVDDVATGLHAAIDKVSLISGTGVYPVFDLVSSQESMREVLEAAGREFGFEGKVELVGAGEDLFAQAMCTSFNGCNGRAKSILGWEPRKVGFVRGMDIFAKAFLAGRS